VLPRVAEPGAGLAAATRRFAPVVRAAMLRRRELRPVLRSRLVRSRRRCHAARRRRPRRPPSLQRRTIDDLPKPPEAELDDSGARYAAKEGDTVRGVDIHIVVSAAGVASPVQLPFIGKLDSELSGDVLIEDRPVAVVGSIAKNEPAHVPPGGSFQKPPKNEGKVIVGSNTVFANDKAVARAGDLVETCSDPKDLPSSVVLCKSTVLVGS
jgi:uncharacterized Zn-binding protein involved in type VI secretion